MRDVNPADNYTKTLGDAYEKALGFDAEDQRTRRLTFDSSASSSSTVVEKIAGKICATGDVGVVFYAGRALHLPALMNGLSLGSSCVERGISVIAGDDTSEMIRPAANAIWNDSNGKIVLYFTALAHSANVSDFTSPVVPGMKSRFGKGDDKSYKRLFPEGTRSTRTGGDPRYGVRLAAIRRSTPTVA